MKKLLFLVVIIATLACTGDDRVQMSPSKEFKAYLSVTECSDGYGIWVVNISDLYNGTMNSMEMADYPASLMAYISWDEDNRLWFYSSDDGRYFYWEQTGQWAMFSWDITITSEVSPPVSLLEQTDRNRRN